MPVLRYFLRNEPEEADAISDAAKLQHSVGFAVEACSESLTSDQEGGTRFPERQFLNTFENS